MTNTITDRILDACREGATMTEIISLAHARPPSVRAMVAQLLSSGWLHKAGTPMSQRYFTDPAMAAAWSPVVIKKTTPYTTDEDRRKTIELANSNGITANALNDKLGTTWKTSKRLLAKLADAGELFVRQTKNGLRYFRSKADAQSWQEPSARPKLIAEKPPRARPAPVTIKRIDHKSAEIVIPKGVKRTQCPSTDHDVRYQLAPGTRVVGGFMSDWISKRGA